MFAWAGNQTASGGFYRVRYTQQPADLPLKLQAKTGALEITFSDPLAAASVSADAFEIKVWSLKRTKNYGSKHFDERPLNVAKATLAQDGKTVRIELPDLAPTWCMEIKYHMKSAEGRPLTGTIHNTIHQLAK
jgi:hypothetical protein